MRIMRAFRAARTAIEMMMPARPKSTAIDTTHVARNSEYLARQIASEVFKQTRAWKTEDIHEFLCDLAEVRRRLEGGTKEFCWSFDRNLTDVSEYEDIYCDRYMIKVEENRIVLEFRKGKADGE